MENQERAEKDKDAIETPRRRTGKRSQEGNVEEKKPKNILPTEDFKKFPDEAYGDTEIPMVQRK